MLNRAVLAVTTTVLVVVFFYAGLVKLVYSEEFAETLRRWSTLPEGLVPAVVFLVPLSELFASLWVLVCRSDARPRLFVALLILVYTAAVLYERGVAGTVSCGCLGEKISGAQDTSILWLTIRNGLLLIAALLSPCLLRLRKGPRDAQA